MATGAAALGMLRKELFTTLGEAERNLEAFVAQRGNAALLQRAVEGLQQVRGTLSLIELTGAELLAQEILQQLTDIPTGAGSERDVQLGALGGALHVLRRYLESVDASRMELPELLIPAIDDLRRASGRPGLPESYFFSVRLELPGTAEGAAADAQRLREEAPRLRLMYQVGLLGYLREETCARQLRLMGRALARFAALLGETPAARLCRVAAACTEAMVDGQLLSRVSRKRLFSQLDRELRTLLARQDYEPPRSLLKELLYLVALADSQGPLAQEVRDTFRLGRLPFTDHLLAEEYARLRGPGDGVMLSLSAAIADELAAAKTLLAQLGERSPEEGTQAALHALLGKLCKTLVMVGLTSAANAVQTRLVEVSGWSAGQLPSAQSLQSLAEALLYVEGMLERLTQAPAGPVAPAPLDPELAFSDHQLAQARIVVIDEARAGLAQTRRAITAYLESDGERSHIDAVPQSLEAVRGGLWFLGQTRTAALVAALAQFIRQEMLNASQPPAAAQMEILADALSSLEYYLEAGELPADEHAEALNLAAEAMRNLGQSMEA